MALLFPGPRRCHSSQPPSLSPSAMPGTAEHPVLFICNLSLCTWMISRQDQERMHLHSLAPRDVSCPNSLFPPLQWGWAFSIPRTLLLGYRSRALLQVRKEKRTGTLILGMCPCRGRLPCPGTIPRDAESQDHIFKHPGHAIPLSLHFFHLLGMVGAGSCIPMVMSRQVTASGFDAKPWSRWLMGRTACPSPHYPPRDRADGNGALHLHHLPFSRGLH